LKGENMGGHNGSGIILPNHVRDTLDIQNRNESIDVLGKVAQEIAAGRVCGLVIQVVMENDSGTSYEGPCHVAVTKKSAAYLAEFLGRAHLGLVGQIMAEAEQMVGNGPDEPRIHTVN